VTEPVNVTVGAASVGLAVSLQDQTVALTAPVGAASVALGVTVGGAVSFSLGTIDPVYSVGVGSAASIGVYSASVGQLGVVALGTDLGGTAASPIVVGLDGTPLGPLAVASVGQVLQWNGTAWVPGTITSGVTSVNGATGVVVLNAASVGADPAGSAAAASMQLLPLSGGTLTGPLAGTSASFSGEIVAQDFSATGIGSASAGARFVGGTTSGAPTSGTFNAGDFIIDQTGKIWFCNVAGSPGQWFTAGKTAVVRSTSASVGPNEQTVWNGTTAAQTLTLPTAAVSGYTNILVNYSTTLAGSGTVTIAPNTGQSLNYFGKTGNYNLSQGESVILSYVATSATTGTWYAVEANNLAYAFFPEASITATGSTLNNAAPLALGYNLVTGATASANYGSGTGVILPKPTILGTQILVENTSANWLVMYPTPGGNIDGGGQDSPVWLPPNCVWTGVLNSLSPVAWTSLVPGMVGSPGQTTIAYGYGNASVGLTTTGVSANTYGLSASTSPTLTIDSYGRITAASSTPIVIPASQLSSGSVNTTAGQLTGGGALSSNPTLGLATSGVSANTYGLSASTSPTLAIDAYGRTTAASSTPIAIPHTSVTDWASNVSALGLSVQAATGGTTWNGTAADGGTIVQWTGSGTSTYNLPTTVPSTPWWVIVTNLNTTGNVQLAPGSKLLNNGSTGYTVQPGQSALVWSDGSNYQMFANFSPATYTFLNNLATAFTLITTSASVFQGSTNTRVVFTGSAFGQTVTFPCYSAGAINIVTNDSSQPINIVSGNTAGTAGVGVITKLDGTTTVAGGVGSASVSGTPTITSGTGGSVTVGAATFPFPASGGSIYVVHNGAGYAMPYTSYSASTFVIPSTYSGPTVTLGPNDLVTSYGFLLSPNSSVMMLQQTSTAWWVVSQSSSANSLYGGPVWNYVPLTNILTSAITNGSTITSLSTSALPYAINAGSVQLVLGATNQILATSGASVGSTSIPITGSPVASFGASVGTGIFPNSITLQSPWTHADQTGTACQLAVGLTSGVSSGSTLTVSPLKFALPSGATVYVFASTSTYQAFTLTARAEIGATTLYVTAQTANATYNTATRVVVVGSGTVTLTQNVYLPAATAAGQQVVVERTLGVAMTVYAPTNSTLGGNNSSYTIQAAGANLGAVVVFQSATGGEWQPVGSFSTDFSHGYQVSGTLEMYNNSQFRAVPTTFTSAQTLGSGSGQYQNLSMLFSNSSTTPYTSTFGTSMTTGIVMWIENSASSAGAVIFNCAGTGTIGGLSSLTLPPGSSMCVRVDVAGNNPVIAVLGFFGPNSVEPATLLEGLPFTVYGHSFTTPLQNNAISWPPAQGGTFAPAGNGLAWSWPNRVALRLRTMDYALGRLGSLRLGGIPGTTLATTANTIVSGNGLRNSGGVSDADAYSDLQWNPGHGAVAGSYGLTPASGLTTQSAADPGIVAMSCAVNDATAQTLHQNSVFGGWWTIMHRGGTGYSSNNLYMWRDYGITFQGTGLNANSNGIVGNGSNSYSTLYCSPLPYTISSGQTFLIANGSSLGNGASYLAATASATASIGATQININTVTPASGSYSVSQTSSPVKMYPAYLLGTEATAAAWSTATSAASVQAALAALNYSTTVKVSTPTSPTVSTTNGSTSASVTSGTTYAADYFQVGDYATINAAGYTVASVGPASVFLLGSNAGSTGSYTATIVNRYRFYYTTPAPVAGAGSLLGNPVSLVGMAGAAQDTVTTAYGGYTSDTPLYTIPQSGIITTTAGTTSASIPAAGTITTTRGSQIASFTGPPPAPGQPIWIAGAGLSGTHFQTNVQGVGVAWGLTASQVRLASAASAGTGSSANWWTVPAQYDAIQSAPTVLTITPGATSGNAQATGGYLTAWYGGASAVVSYNTPASAVATALQGLTIGSGASCSATGGSVNSAATVLTFTSPVAGLWVDFSTLTTNFGMAGGYTAAWTTASASGTFSGVPTWSGTPFSSNLTCTTAATMAAAASVNARLASSQWYGVSSAIYGGAGFAGVKAAWKNGLTASLRWFKSDAGAANNGYAAFSGPNKATTTLPSTSTTRCTTSIYGAAVPPGYTGGQFPWGQVIYLQGNGLDTSLSCPQVGAYATVTGGGFTTVSGTVLYVGPNSSYFVISNATSQSTLSGIVANYTLGGASVGAASVSLNGSTTPVVGDYLYDVVVGHTSYLATGTKITSVTGASPNWVVGLSASVVTAATGDVVTMSTYDLLTATFNDWVTEADSYATGTPTYTSNTNFGGSGNQSATAPNAGVVNLGCSNTYGSTIRTTSVSSTPPSYVLTVNDAQSAGEVIALYPVYPYQNNDLTVSNSYSTGFSMVASVGQTRYGVRTYGMPSARTPLQTSPLRTQGTVAAPLSVTGGSVNTVTITKPAGDTLSPTLHTGLPVEFDCVFTTTQYPPLVLLVAEYSPPAQTLLFMSQAFCELMQSYADVSSQSEFAWYVVTVPPMTTLLASDLNGSTYQQLHPNNTGQQKMTTYLSNWMAANVPLWYYGPLPFSRYNSQGIALSAGTTGLGSRIGYA